MIPIRLILLLLMSLCLIIGNSSCGGRGGDADPNRRPEKMQGADPEKMQGVDEGKMQGADPGKIGGPGRDTIAENIAAGVYSNGTAAKKEVVLPDGTKLLMHAGTAVYLSKKFDWGNRELRLDGDVLFEVVVAEGNPFLIDTHNLQIRVQGSGARFRVDARLGEAGEEVDVLTGELKVMKSYHSNSDNEPEIIKSGEMAMINRDIDLMEKEKMDGSELKGWDLGQ